MTQLHLIDAIGPFFRGHDARTINWSKIPWHLVPTDDDAWWAGVRAELRVICEKASAWDFNAISLDDVAHLADHEWLEPELRTRVAAFRREFAACFTICAEFGLQVFVTMDVMSLTPALKSRLEAEKADKVAFLAELLDSFLAGFPQISGVIARIGEADGKGVRDEFRSELTVKTPSQARELLKSLLPVFEKHGRTFIFRTWTVGAYPIGDLMWHRGTFERVFGDLESDSLVVSMKYGESDFFRYLPLNKNFFRTKVKKIVELQTRREYEGCGEYPSFVGWEYEKYVRELRQSPDVIGCMVWCQTGGWVPFRRLAFLDAEALWIDLNTFVTIQVMRGSLVESAVRAYAKKRGLPDAGALLELLRLSDEVVRELLYTEEFARQKLFFRRVRIPPQLQVYWGNIFINHSIKKLLTHFVKEPEGALRAAARCLDLLDQMLVLAPQAGVPVEDIQFMRDTFRLLALAREYYFTKFTPELEARLREAKRDYKARWPKRGMHARYRVKMDFKPFWLKRRYLSWALEIVLRRHRGYRTIDRLLTLNLFSMIYQLIIWKRPHWIPGFAKKSAMGVDVVFR